MNQIVDSNELAKAIANKIVLVLHSNNQDVCVTKKHFRFFVTDSAPTSTTTCKILKQFCPNLKHSTCLAHNFYKFSRKISKGQIIVKKFNMLFVKGFQK